MDVIVAVPVAKWAGWLGQGDLAGEEWSGREHAITVNIRPEIEAGERVYIACDGIVRGYAPLIRMETIWSRGRFTTELVRGGGAVAMTPMCSLPDSCDCLFKWAGPHPTRVTVRGCAYRSWDRAWEWLLGDWQKLRKR